MPINPTVNVTPLDGGIGVASRARRRIGILGVCSGGTALDTLHTSDKDEVKSTFTRGPAVELACHLLEHSKEPIAVDICKVDATVAGAAGTPAVTRVDSSDGTVTVKSGTTPNDGYEVVVEITTSTDSTADGDGAFRISLDGGDSFSAPIAIPKGTSPTEYPVANTGLTLEFTDGVATPTFEDGDLFEIDCTAPGYSTSDLGDAFDALFAEPYDQQCVVVVGEASNASNSAGVASTVKSKIEARSTAKHWTWALMQANIDTATEDAADLIDAFASFDSKRVGVCALHVELESAVDNGRKYKRGAVYAAALKVASDPIHYDMGQVGNDGLGGGSMQGVSGIYNIAGTLVKKFDTGWEALDSARFITPRTWEQVAGFYITQGNLMSVEGSDYDLHQYRQIMDVACSVTYGILVKYANAHLRTNPADGTIDARDADAIDDLLGERLSDRLVVPNNIQAVVATVRRDINLQTTRTLQAKVQLLPHAYVKEATGEVGFVTVIANIAA